MGLCNVYLKAVAFFKTGGIINSSSRTGNAHVSNGSYPDELPTGISSRKQQSGSESSQ